ncbi:MAG: hypothetical protein EAZ08_11165 [Cytophagales bacterium]|nr:MAG: hypothetical protein EAZ08_11165 [Cytophagales bacterium]
MSSLKVGGVHPVAKKNTEVQLSVAKENREFLDVIFYNLSKSKDYAKAWGQSALRYGLYVENNIPFVLVELAAEKKSYSLPINAYEISQSERSKWLGETEATMNVFLINATNNMIESVRSITFNASIAAELRKTCQAQLTQYKDAASVSQATATIASQKNAPTMITKAKMISLLQV